MARPGSASSAMPDSRGRYDERGTGEVTVEQPARRGTAVDRARRCGRRGGNARRSAGNRKADGRARAARERLRPRPRHHPGIPRRLEGWPSSGPSCSTCGWGRTGRRRRPGYSNCRVERPPWSWRRSPWNLDRAALAAAEGLVAERPGTYPPRDAVEEDGWERRHADPGHVS